MTPEAAAKPEPIRDQREVNGLLRRLIDTRAIIHIWHPDGHEGHLSTIIGLKPPVSIYLDAPPESAIDLYRPGDQLQVRTRLDGTDVRFRTRLQLHSRYEGYAALLCEWPAEVHHYERRLTFRVRVTGKEAGVTLELDDGDERHRGRLVDLSLGGFGALIDAGAQLSAGEVLDCVLELQGQQLATQAAIQSFEPIAGTRFWRLGARFLDLDPMQERRLGKLVLELERQSIQHSRGL
ncbi:MAG: flagellar brake protein [Wenzhouxiangella sp.]